MTVSLTLLLVALFLSFYCFQNHLFNIKINLPKLKLKLLVLSLLTKIITISRKKYATHLTDGVRSTPQDSARIGCGKQDRQGVGASSVVRPSCSPLLRPGCKLHWDLRAVKKLLVD